MLSNCQLNKGSKNSCASANTAVRLQYLWGLANSTLPLWNADVLVCTFFICLMLPEQVWRFMDVLGGSLVRYPTEWRWLYLMSAQKHSKEAPGCSRRNPCWYSWSLLFQEKYIALFVFRDRPNTLLRVHKEIYQWTPSLFLLNIDSSEVPVI